MYRKPILSLFFVLCFLVAQTPLRACGYSFVGSCSSDIGLRINGTSALFTVADCSYGNPFNGMALSDIQSLSISYAFAATWESCYNNVTGMTLCYRVFQQGTEAGNWSFYSLKQDSSKLDLPYTTRYRSSADNVVLTNGLSAGKTYVLEIYFRADIDTIGDDFVPETVLLQNNNGRNYSMTFRYGGLAAPPFLILPTQVVLPSCFGKTDGSVEVTVFGNPSGIQYQWSTSGPAIPAIYNIGAGVYTVTVSNGSGISQAIPIPLGQPTPVVAVFPLIKPISCGGLGVAIAAGSGGSPSYNYKWSTGSTTNSVNVTMSGSFQVTITDARGCSKTASATVPMSGTIKRIATATICQGTTFQAGGQNYTTPGTYTYNVAGTTCDTTVTLTLTVLKPADALATLPASVSTSACNGIVPEICGIASPNTSFLWYKNNVLSGVTPCFTGIPGNNYSVTVYQTADGKICEASKNVEYQSTQGTFTATVNGLVEPDYCKPTSPLAVFLSAATAASNPSFQWLYDGQVIATSSTLNFTVTLWQPPYPVLPVLMVKDGNGCQTTATSNVIVLLPPNYDIIATVKNVTAGQSNGSVSAQINGGIEPFKYAWSNGTTTPAITQLLPGTYCLTVTDNEDCTRTKCLTVDVTSQISDVSTQKISIAPNPVAAGGVFQIELPENFEGGKMKAEILGSDGRAFLCDMVPTSQKTAQVFVPDGLSAGIYFLRITEATQIFLGRLAILNPY